MRLRFLLWTFRHRLSLLVAASASTSSSHLGTTVPVFDVGSIYRPDPADRGAARGSILRGGCERVFQVPSRQDLREFLTANTESGEYDSAIKLIEISIKTNTDSVSGYVRAPDPGSMQPDWWQTICRAAIEIFDKPPRSSNGGDKSGDIGSEYFHIFISCGMKYPNVPKT